MSSPQLEDAMFSQEDIPLLCSQTSKIDLGDTVLQRLLQQQVLYSIYGEDLRVHNSSMVSLGAEMQNIFVSYDDAWENIPSLFSAPYRDTLERILCTLRFSHIIGRKASHILPRVVAQLDLQNLSPDIQRQVNALRALIRRELRLLFREQTLLPADISTTKTYRLIIHVGAWRSLAVIPMGFMAFLVSSVARTPLNTLYWSIGTALWVLCVGLIAWIFTGHDRAAWLRNINTTFEDAERCIVHHLDGFRRLNDLLDAISSGTPLNTMDEENQMFLRRFTADYLSGWTHVPRILSTTRINSGFLPGYLWHLEDET